MNKIFLLITISLFTSICLGQNSNTIKSIRDQVCRSLINNITSNNYEKAVETMDKIVLEKIPKDTVKKAMAILASTLKEEFKGKINKVTFVSSDKTILNDLPAIFMIYKLESETKFGYYYFYLNENSNKVMLISRFTKVEPKRL